MILWQVNDVVEQRQQLAMQVPDMIVPIISCHKRLYELANQQVDHLKQFVGVSYVSTILLLTRIRIIWYNWAKIMR